MQQINIKLKTGKYKSNHNSEETGCIYYLTFEYGKYYMQRICEVKTEFDGKVSESKYPVHEGDIIKQMIFGGLVLIEEVNTEKIQQQKEYKEHKNRKTSSRGKIINPNQQSIF